MTKHAFSEKVTKKAMEQLDASLKFNKNQSQEMTQSKCKNYILINQ